MMPRSTHMKEIFESYDQENMSILFYVLYAGAFLMIIFHII